MILSFRLPISQNLVHPAILPKLTDRSTELEVFSELFPKSLIHYIVQCTNERLAILRDDLKNHKKNYLRKQMLDTDYGEIQMIIGIMLVMSYNKVPNLSDNWSGNVSFGNTFIKTAISRTPFQVLYSKMYFTNPQKPADASKTYYLDDLVECLKGRFLQARADSQHQSIDETMVKFKGRSTLKQYMPAKPTKRGVKLWTRSDSATGYCYDFNIYRGQETEDGNPTVTVGLGEKVVLALARTVESPYTTFSFDRFFTSIHLMETFPYSAVGRVMSNRKNVPKSSKKLNKYDYEFLGSANGVLVSRWQDSKEVVVVSNCHTAATSMVSRKQKNGTKLQVVCPQSIEFYNSTMGGVDLTDQKVGIYDADRKSEKWWRKVFYRLFMTSVTNSWILFEELRGKSKSFLQFVVPLAEQMITQGKSTCAIKRKTSVGRPTKRKTTLRFGDHLPVCGKTRRRCARCAQKFRKETRTKQICCACNIPLCKDCFRPFHIE